MEKCRLSIAATGAFIHPLGDQTPIDCRYGEMLDTVQLPHKQILLVSAPTEVSYASLVNPRMVIVWNVSGQNLQTNPTPEEAEKIARQTLEIGLAGEGQTPTGWQLIRPVAPGSAQGGNAILWLRPDTRVILRPEHTGVTVTVRVLVVPGQ